MLSFFPRDVLNEICDLIGLVSEGFPTYFCIGGHSREAPKLEFNARDTPRYSATVQSANPAWLIPGKIGEGISDDGT